MTSPSTFPPPGFASQQPLVSPKPKGPEFVKALSSQTTKIAELPSHAGEEVISLTRPCRNVSPSEMMLCSFEKSHGSLGVAALPCMSLHWSGAMKL